MNAISTEDGTTMYCTFLLGGEHYCVRVDEVQEVISRQKICPVPLAPPAVEGLINLRGEIVTTINLRRRFEIEAESNDEVENPMNVVLRGDYGPTSLKVDAIGDVVHAAPSEIDDTPETLVPTIRELVRGVIRRDDRLVLLLETEKVVNVEDRA